MSANGKRGAISRATAAIIVDQVLSHGRSLEQALPQNLRANLDPRDASFIKALVYGALRGHPLHQQLIHGLLSKPLKQKDAVLEALLSVSLFQLLESERPDFAVVSAAVDATAVLKRPHARGLVNAVLRNFLRQRDSLLAAAATDESVRYRLPVWLLHRLQAAYPQDWSVAAEASTRQAPMWLRVNKVRTAVADYQQRLAAAGHPTEQAPACSATALKLLVPAPVDQLPGFADGDCSVQDIAAQLAAQILAPKHGEHVLDACAAPGGKSCHLAELTANSATLIALDSSAERVERILENAERLNANIMPLVGDATTPDVWWDGDLFDRILIDAPCSATGVIRRHPDIAYLRRDTDIETLTTLQATILDRLWPLLKPGGQLLYATCSILPAENGELIAAFLKREATAECLPINLLENLATPLASPGSQLLPGNPLDSDGFYYALLQKQK
jgi:16S rRNA (cytosine967-C5)-methyltransferase